MPSGTPIREQRAGWGEEGLEDGEKQGERAVVKVEVKHSPSHQRVFIWGVTSSDLDNETGPAENQWQSSAESWLMQSFRHELQTPWRWREP